VQVARLVLGSKATPAEASKGSCLPQTDKSWQRRGRKSGSFWMSRALRRMARIWGGGGRPLSPPRMMAGELFTRGMRERGLDNFLVEELYASPEFRAWFVARAGRESRAPENLEIRLHKSPARNQDSRQTDVRMGWFADDSTLKAAILIENKVGSGFQEGQAAAYAAEAEALRTELGAYAVATMLVAPRAQFSSLVHDGDFDGMIG